MTHSGLKINNNTLRGRIIISLIVILTIASHYSLKYFNKYILFGEQRYNQLPWQLKTFLVICLGLFLCFTVVFILSNFSFKLSGEILGMNKGIAIPFLAAAISTLPAFIGYAM